MSEKNNEPTNKSFFERLLDYVLKNPFITLSSIAMMVGGLVGFLHYARLGYVPEIDLKSAATIFISLALTGTALTVALAVIFMTPAFYLRMIFSKKSTPTVPKDSIQEAELATRRRTATLSIRAALSATGLWCVILWLAMDNISAWTGIYGAFLIFISTGGTRLIDPFLAHAGKHIKRNIPNAAKSWLTKNSDFLASTFVWAFALMLIGLMLGSSIFNNKNLSYSEKALCLFGFLSVVIFVNSMLAIPGIAQTRLASLIFLLVAGTPVTCFLILPNNPFSIEKTTFSKLGLGSVENSLFLVKPETCDAINIIRKNTCVPVAAATANAAQNDLKRNGCVRPKYLENRLGTEYLLVYEDQVPSDIKGANHNASKLLIPLKKDDVLLWAFGQTAKSGDSMCPSGQSN